MSKGWVISGVVGVAVLTGVAASSGCSGAVGSSGGDGSSSGGGSSGGSGVCASPPAVENSVPPTGPQQCGSCSTSSACSASQPLDACCVWVAESHDTLADGTGLHRYSTADTSAQPDLSCLAVAPTPLGNPTNVTLTGYVWLFSAGQDSSDVQVDVFTENHPQTPDGSISAASLGTYTTSSADPIDPTDTSWNSKCPNGCSYRQFSIPNVPTETPLVIKTSDAGKQKWATLYDYNVYFKTADVQNGQVTYDATAVAGPDLVTVAGTIGLTPDGSKGLLAGEVHDCSDVRLYGATVSTDQTPSGQNAKVFYFTEDESDPLPSLEANDTSHLSLFGGLNFPTGTPIRVSATAKDPANAGSFLMLGTYVVQVYPGAVTAIALRGRRPWQP